MGVSGGIGGGRVVGVGLRVGVLPDLTKLKTQVIDKTRNSLAEFRIRL